MRRVTVSFAVASCWVLCSLAPVGAEDSLPENGKIAFDTGIISTVEPDGSNLSVVTSGTHPNWSPDGTKIAFTSGGPPGQLRFSIVEPDGSNLKNILLPTELTGSNPVSGPTWSPDGKEFVFSSAAGTDSNRDIYTIDSDGSNLINLTKTPEHDEVFPTFSPDGSQICLFMTVTEATPAAGIYVMDADGSDPTLLADADIVEQCDWSPDGRKIAFASDKDGDLDIYTIDADGNGRTKLTSNSHWDVDPDWSPDGRKIAFASGMPLGLNIHTLNADGSDRARLTNLEAGAAQYPDWQPLPRPTSSKSRSLTVDQPDTGGPSLLLAASALLFCGGVMFYAGLKRKV